MKPTKHSVAIAVQRQDAAGRLQVLAVLRPPDDRELPDVWGLPAASLRPDEGWDEAALRVGREKLGVTLELKAELRDGTAQRASYLLHMKLYDARIREGEPSVPQPHPEVTQYVRWKWAGPRELITAARRGSLCCRLYLRELALGWT